MTTADSSLTTIIWWQQCHDILQELTSKFLATSYAVSQLSCNPVADVTTALE